MCPLEPTWWVGGGLPSDFCVGCGNFSNGNCCHFYFQSFLLSVELLGKEQSKVSNVIEYYLQKMSAVH